jgi:hypothetical protein
MTLIDVKGGSPLDSWTPRRANSDAARFGDLNRRRRLVEVRGVEPLSSGDLLGLLRAQPADHLARRLPQAEHRRTSLASMSRAGREAHPAR